MTLIAFIRHGDTEWNRRGLIQGSTDIALDADGRALVAAWRVPPQLIGFDWLSSPMARARETAHILSRREPATDARLSEMCWGGWEGCTIPDLRAELGDLMRAWEARGLDFCGPGGESPRDVQERLRPVLKKLSGPAIFVTHKGVLRALYALATGWSMTEKGPDKLRDGTAHAFLIAADGTPEVQRLNIPLERGS